MLLSVQFGERRVRVAFVDLYFSWPPHGGADVDLYHVASGVQGLGHDVHVFVAACEESWERGTVDPAKMPFPATRLDFRPDEITPVEMPRRFRTAVDAWKPDVVFLADGFFLKSYVAEALVHYPLISRYYAYELTCPRDTRLFLNGAPCPMNYLRTPNVCRPCALQGLRGEILRWRFLSWSEEYIASRAYMPGYHAHLLRFLRSCRTIIVSNPLPKAQLDGLHDDVREVPGGVQIDEFQFVPPREKAREERKVILMTGRVEDTAKGMDTLRDAGALLAERRRDFEIRVTHTDFSLSNDWFKAIGWHDHAGIMRLYQESDICVVPSLWDEPFGLVAVEAMASGRPVCASRAGGLQGIVLHDETGFLFDRGDSAALAEYLGRLLDDSELRARMGANGRARAEQEYDWKRVVAKYYPAILEGRR